MASALIAIIVSGATDVVRAETQVERGAYLVTAVAACATCHTPRSPSGSLLSGGNVFKVGPTTVLAPNITPDKDTGIGAWSDAQIIAAIRNDVKPDGSRIGPPMPQKAFATISNTDAAAIVAYLRTVTPVRHKVDGGVTPTSTPLLDANLSVAAPSLASAFDRGRYLVDGPAHCVECHEIGNARLSVSPRVFNGPWGSIMAPTLSPDFVKKYAPGDFKRVVTNGLRPDGSKLVGPMPVASYSHLRDDDIADIAAYLSADVSP